MCSRNTDTHNHSLQEDYLDAKPDQEEALDTTNGKAMPHADSSVVNSFTRPIIPVRLEDPTNGPESPDASEVPSSPVKDSTTRKESDLFYC